MMFQLNDDNESSIHKKILNLHLHLNEFFFVLKEKNVY